MSDKLKQLEKDYSAVPIPDALDFVVEYALQENKRLQKRKRLCRPLIGAIIVAILSICILTHDSLLPQLLNKTSLPTTQTAMDEANNKVLKRENKAIAPEVSMNYMANTHYFDTANISNNYIVGLASNDILSLAKYSTTFKPQLRQFEYSTIDTAKMAELQLADLFVDDRYINVINTIIIQQLQTQRNTNKDAIFPRDFTTITPNQSFYITKDYKLVIIISDSSISKERFRFEIPTAALQPFLVSQQYIK